MWNLKAGSTPEDIVSAGVSADRGKAIAKIVSNKVDKQMNALWVKEGQLDSLQDQNVGSDYPF